MGSLGPCGGCNARGIFADFYDNSIMRYQWRFFWRRIVTNGGLRGRVKRLTLTWNCSYNGVTARRLCIAIW